MFIYIWSFLYHRIRMSVIVQIVPGNKDRVRPPAYRHYNWGRRECEVRSFMSQIGDARTAFFQVTKTSAAPGESICHRPVKAQASLI